MATVADLEARLQALGFHRAPGSYGCQWHRASGDDGSDILQGWDVEGEEPTFEDLTSASDPVICYHYRTDDSADALVPDCCTFAEAVALLEGARP